MGRKKWAVTITIEEPLAEPTKAIAFANHLTISKLINYALLHLYESPEGKWLSEKVERINRAPTTLKISNEAGETMTYEDMLERLNQPKE